MTDGKDFTTDALAPKTAAAERVLGSQKNRPVMTAADFGTDKLLKDARDKFEFRNPLDFSTATLLSEVEDNESR